MNRTFPIDDPSRVAEIRRAAVAICEAEGLEEGLVANAALVTTEICTNIVRHASKGEVFLCALSNRSQAGLEILAIDRGPGMADVTRCMVDGYSSAKTSGTGLGAVGRLSREFDIYSSESTGTVLVSRIQRSNGVRTNHSAESPWTGALTGTWIGGVLKPMAGEEVSGDSWAFSEQEKVFRVLVADGLGHGLMAARASEQAVMAFRSSNAESPLALLEDIHRALRSTRGAAVALAYVERGIPRVRYAGLGNIAGVLVTAPKPVFMVSHNGTAGFHSPRLQEFSYPLSEGALLVMHSDGLHTNWNLDDYPGLRRRDPSIIAGVLYRDFARNRDDACVVVAKLGGAA